MSANEGRIVVGVEDTEESDHAIRWAAHNALARNKPLHLVHAFVWPLMGVDVDPVPGVSGSGLKVAAQRLLDEAAQIAHEVAPGCEVTTQIVDGRAVDVLIQQSETADALVVGSRGLGRFLSIIVGSTSSALLTRSKCSIVVVRGDIAADGPVAVFYDGGTAFECALERAAEFAKVYGTGVRVIPSIVIPEEKWAGILESAQRHLREVAPEVDVEITEYGRQHTAKELIRRSEGTRLIVANARGKHGELERQPVVSNTAFLQYANTPVWLERQ